MKIPKRDTTVFSLSAIDLFASSFGAFILIVMLLYPYYRKTTVTPSPPPPPQTTTVDVDAIAQALAGAQSAEARRAELERQVASVQRAIKDTEAKLAESSPKQVQAQTQQPKPARTNIANGVDFTILGLATSAKRIVVVIDMSGSMHPYAQLMIRSVLEILAPLKERHRFAIIGYRNDNGLVLERFPTGGGMTSADNSNVQSAIRFTNGLSSRFAGGTPTHKALLAAMEYDAEAIILMSDGEPTDSAWQDIVNDVTLLNRKGKRKEIHTVALGDYTKERKLTSFLQQLAKRNGGNFVGISE